MNLALPKSLPGFIPFQGLKEYREEVGTVSIDILMTLGETNVVFINQ